MGRKHPSPHARCGFCACALILVSCLLAAAIPAAHAQRAAPAADHSTGSKQVLQPSPRAAICIGGRTSGSGCICPQGAVPRRTGPNAVVCRRTSHATPNCSGGRVLRGACVCPPGATLRAGVCRSQDDAAPRTPPTGGSKRPSQTTGNDDRDDQNPRRPNVGGGTARHPALRPPSGPVKIAPAPPLRPPGQTVTAADVFVSDEVVGTLGRTTPTGLDEDVAAAFNLVLVERAVLALTGERLVRYRIPDGRDVQDVVAALAIDGRVTAPQPNYVYVRQGSLASGIPNDLQYAPAKIELAAAHEVARGAGVLVGVLDTGVDARHPELAGVIAEEIEVTGPAPRGAMTDFDPHGTAIAGIIAAHGVVKGIAPHARILSVRTFRPGVGGGRAISTTALVCMGIDQAIARGATILNFSFAGARDPLMHRLAGAAVARNVLLVAAAGNNGPDAQPAYPASYPEVIAVTATDQYDKLYAKANHGHYIAVAAPGVDVLTLGAARSHQLQSGTSFAAAHVSGILALMLELAPGLTVDRARAALAAAAVDLGPPGHDAQFGAGRISASEALRGLSVSRVPN